MDPLPTSPNPVMGETKHVKVMREHPPVVLDRFLAVCLIIGVSAVILALIIGLVVVVVALH